MLYFLLVIPITLVCLLAFAGSLSYLVISSRLLVIAAKENSGLKYRGSLTGIALSITGLLLNYWLWTSMMSWAKEISNGQW